jgi:hypothetical protein
MVELVVGRRIVSAADLATIGGTTDPTTARRRKALVIARRAISRPARLWTTHTLSDRYRAWNNLSGAFVGS